MRTAMLCQTARRPTRLIAAASVCATLLAGCASGIAHDAASAPSASAPASGSAPATNGQAPRARAATSPVPAPRPGNIHQRVAARTVVTERPVALDAVAHFGTGVTARITSVKAVQVQAVGPGEVSGPGLDIDIEVTNHTAKAIDLGNAVVTITDAEGTPGVLMIFAPEASSAVDKDVPAVSADSFSRPLTGSLAPHATASGTYVFTIPVGHRKPISVNVSYAGNAPVAVFRGDTA